MPPATPSSPDSGLQPGPAAARLSPGGKLESPSGDGWRNRFVQRLEAGGRYPRWVLLAALAGMFASTFPITILTVSLGNIAREFATSETTIAWVISGPMLLSAVALPLLGKLGDLYGHRRVFLSGFAGATVVAGLTAIAWDPLSLIGFRTLAAILGAATQPTAMALIFSVYPPGERVKAMGWWSMTGAAAPALGLIAGGPLVDLLGWRVVFIFQAALSALSLLLAWIVLRETPRQRVRFDVAGAATLAVGVAGFMFALGKVRDLGLMSPWIGAGVLVGVVGLTAFLRVERRTPEPLIPLAFFSERRFTAPILSNAFMASAYMGAFVIAPLVLLEEFEYSISVAAGIMLLRTLTLTLSSPVGGSLGQRIGERAAAVVGAGIMTVSLVVIAWSVLNREIVGVGIGLVLQGMGHGLALPSLTSAVASAVREKDLGIASAANRLTSQTGAAFGITTLTLVYGGLNSPEAFSRAFLVGAALSAVSLAAAFGMSRVSHHPESVD